MKTIVKTPAHPEPTREQIALRAYELYQARGGRSGPELDDWLQAEYELMQLPIRKLAELKPSRPRKGQVRASALVALVQAALFFGTSGITQFRR